MNGALVHLHLGVEGWLPMPCGVAAPVEVVVAAGGAGGGGRPHWAVLGQRARNLGRRGENS
jgi:hypothetical protein